MSYQTPNMSLIGISIGVDSGIVIEENINLNTSVLDQHDHSNGSGVQIKPSGININSSLPFNGNAAANVGYLNLATLTTPPPLNVSVFSLGVDLYYLDGNGNSIQITSGGSVFSTSSGISSGTNSASFVSNVLVVNSAPGIPANIQVGSVLLGNGTFGTKFLTLSPPAAMAANFSLILPSLPVSTSFMTLDTSGNMAGSIPIANGITASNIANQTVTATQIANQTITATQIANATITSTQMAANSVGTTQLQNGSVTQAKRSALNITSSGAFTSTPTTAGFTLIATLSITTTGRPVALSISPAPSISSQGLVAVPLNQNLNVYIFRDGTRIYSAQFSSGGITGAGGSSITWPSSVTFTDYGATAATHSYALEANQSNSAGSIQNAEFIAYEL